MTFRSIALVAFAALSLSRCAAPGPAACVLTKVADFPVTFVSGNLPTIVIKIDGIPERMVVDTGASVTLLMPAAYENLRGTPLTRLYGVYGTGAGGDMGVDTAILEDLEIGNVELKDQGMFVVNFGIVDQRPGQPRVDGMLGFDVLQTFDVAFDLPDRLITFYEPQTCASEQTPWTGSYDAEAFIARPDRLNEPNIPINVDGQTMTLLIDSGADFTMITQRAVAANGLAPEASDERTFRGVGIGNLAFSNRPEQFASVTIGAEDFSNMWLRVGNIAATPDSPMQGTLGEDYLRHHRVFLANTARTAYLGLTNP